MITLTDCIHLLAFYFDEPKLERTIAHTLMPVEKFDIFKTALSKACLEKDSVLFLVELKRISKTVEIEPRSVFSFVRYALTGRIHGIGIAELIDLLGFEKSILRITHLSNSF